MMKKQSLSNEVIRWYVEIKNSDTISGYKKIYFTDVEKNHYLEMVARKLNKIMIKGEEYQARDVLLKRVQPKEINKQHNEYLKWKADEDKRQEKEKQEMAVEKWIKDNPDKYGALKATVIFEESNRDFWKKAKEKQHPETYEKYFGRHVKWVSEARINKFLQNEDRQTTIQEFN
ncbi:MAG: hypothetical protein V3U02_04395 [Calditrichia bacterium]